MQHLLDFVHEHSLEQQLYLTALTPAGELELIWQRGECEGDWRVRPRGCEGPAERVPRAELLRHLETRQADMPAIARELQALVAIQIVFADMLLRDATKLLGRDAVASTREAHREFVTLLVAAVRQLVEPARPNVQLISGEAAQSPLRTGHLSLVR